MPRYTVETWPIPEALHDGEGDPMFDAWVKDNSLTTAVSWHADITDAERVCAALNRDDQAAAR